MIACSARPKKVGRSEDCPQLRQFAVGGVLYKIGVNLRWLIIVELNAHAIVMKSIEGLAIGCFHA